MTTSRVTSGSRPATFPLHLLEEISHRVVNEYAEAIASLNIAARGACNSEARETLALAAERLRAHADSHRALLPPASDGPVDVGDYVARVCLSFSTAVLAERDVRVAVETEDIRLPADRCWRLGLIVAELVRNAARHGLEGRPGSIVVRLLKTDDGLRCIVCDDGRASQNGSTGRGQLLVRLLAADLGGQVAWSFTPHGARVCFEAPITGGRATC